MEPVIPDHLGVPMSHPVSLRLQLRRSLIGFSLFLAVLAGPVWAQAQPAALVGSGAVAPGRFNGVLVDGKGKVSGSLAVSLSAKGTAATRLRLGAAESSAKLVPLTAGDTTMIGTTTFGQLTLDFGTPGVAGASLVTTGATFTGTLHAARTAATAATYHVALASENSAIPGGGYAIVKVTKNGTTKITGLLPDGNAFSTKTVLTDDDAFAFYDVQKKGAEPPGVFGGVLALADLERTDVSGDLVWSKPAQAAGAKGTHLGGVDTTLTARGSRYAGVLPFTAGYPYPLLRLSGGNLAATESALVATVSGIPPAPTGALQGWTGVKADTGVFIAKVLVPGIPKPVIARGVYLPKYERAWGYFPGTTEGGRIELESTDCSGPLADGAAGPYSGFNNWFHGSVLGGDANKGARVGDQPEADPVQRFETTASSSVVADKWRKSFAGVDRCNRVLNMVEPPPQFPLTLDEQVRLHLRTQARFLRALYYFELRRTFGAVPYVDETLDGAAAAAVPNDVDIYPAIEADFQFAIDNLPETAFSSEPELWANKWAATAFLGKVYLYQGKFAAAKNLFDQVINNGKTASGLKYALLSRYADNFTGVYTGNGEAVFAVQTAVTPKAVEIGVTPTRPRGSGPAGCCGFFQPSFDLVNSFRTDPNGLPLPGTYNSNAVASDFGIVSATPFIPDSGLLDPRIDHAVGRRGIPFLNWGDHPGADWILDQAYGGPYSPKKYVLPKPYRGVTHRGLTNLNQSLMRYADVLLMAAECEIEIGSLEKAREYVNVVRSRAANPASWVKRSDGSNAANYVIGLYNTPWVDKGFARTAVRFERKLELAGEGHRFYDLVRWGTAASTIQSYLQFDGATLGAALGGASFTAGKNERYPIPQEQIDARGPGVLQQNPGY